MEKIKVLFVCSRNSARSQMAEAFLDKNAGDYFEVSSGGLVPGKLNPMAVTAMSYIGIDISGNKTKNAQDLFKMGMSFDYVITVSNEASGEQFPIFPGTYKKQHWEIPDMSAFTGTYSYRLERTRHVRNMIEQKVKGFIKDITAFDNLGIEAKGIPESRNSDISDPHI